jgi:ABC-type branched-subunit amino acid transport system substrate-binding protein
MRRNSWRLLAALMALGLVAGACGGGDRADGPGDDESPTTSSDAVEDGPSGGFGDLESPCGPAEDGTELTDQGDFVTAETITIGYGDDAGYQAAPGLNAQMSDAIVAMMDWCNEQGGINGREVVGEYYDAKILEANNVMIEACDQVFMLVGQGWAFDGAAEQTRVGCGLPQVPGYTVSGTVAHGPDTYVAVPNPIDMTPAGHLALMAEQYPDRVPKAAALYADYAAQIEVMDKIQAAAPDFGWEFIPDCEQTYPIGGVAQWAPYVQKLKDCGAGIVYWVGSPLPMFQNLLEAAAQADLDMVYLTDANNYEENFALANTAGYADTVHMRMAFTPFEQADRNEATQQYLDVLEASGGTPSLLGAQATSAFLLWATAAQSCGAELTRQCVLDELATITAWTGGGLHAESNPAENMPPECVMVLGMDGTSFVQALPEEQGEFACDPSYVATVDIPATAEAKLDTDRISQAYTTG